VLAPTLALTSIAGATPPDWSVRYWDENLLQGSPPCEPFPSVVGITVHLTFAKRAYELSRFYRERGAKVVLGGLPGKWARNASLARLEPACGRCGESYPPAGRATSACSTSFDALLPAIT
jgi:hypothetical protein